MSYSLELVNQETREVLHMPQVHHFQGANYPIGGTTECSLSITYNYGSIYRRVHPEEGINDIHGKTGKESVEILADMIGKLGDDMNPDYWTATEGNAKKPLFALLTFAAQHPDGVWEID